MRANSVEFVYGPRSYLRLQCVGKPRPGEDWFEFVVHDEQGGSSVMRVPSSGLSSVAAAALLAMTEQQGDSFRGQLLALLQKAGGSP